MKIVINTAHQRFGGAVQVANSFIHECIHFPEHEYHVWLGPGVGDDINTDIFPPNFIFYRFNFGPIGFNEIRRIQKTLRTYELKIMPDILISSSGPSYYHSIAPQILGYNLPWYIYPESPFMKDIPLRKKIKYWIRKKIHFYFFKRDAVAYLVQTDDVRDRVKIALNTNNVYTITNNHNHYYSEKKSAKIERLSTPSENEFRFLTLSSYYPHKNLELISDGTELLMQKGYYNIKFVLTLKDDDFKKYIRANELVINVGSVKPSECPDLYAECNGMFLPTLAECFSASYPEAMAMNKPIITTDLGFARSICGQAAIYFTPKNANDAVEKIIMLYENKSLQMALIERGKIELEKFDSAKNRGAKYLELCKVFSKK
jgi:glycosyltransferase involved in cell wall biosynthesis